LRRILAERAKRQIEAEDAAQQQKAG